MLAKTTEHGYNLAQENHSGFNFKIGISRNTKCDNLVSFSKSGHIFTFTKASACMLD